MSRNTSILLILLVLLVGGIFWYQYRFYRTPVEVPVDDTRQIVLGTAHKDDIPAIDEPVFESVASADVYLNDAGYGIAVAIGSRVRFYPFQILVWHEVVNDTLSGRDLLVTYDPLTYASAVYDRTDTFGVSGKLWNSNLLLYDRTTESLWSQLRGEAIDGTRVGTRLTRYPSRVMAWVDYKSTYSSGQVLSRETGFDRDYTQNPYEGYDESQAIWFPLDHEDTRLAPKSLVYGAMQGGTAMAFLVDSVSEFDTIQAIVGEDEVLVPVYWFAWVAMFPETQIYSLSQ
ncbi:MAG: DUF3179 domain-containing protein [Candidatus Uhrbacteria bacterium]|nr:DUF3179 domain-containing protein [Candidatus Uhrbacteria bacterium]